MKCQDCGEPATVHQPAEGTSTELPTVHLCRSCAEKRQLIAVAPKPNLPMVVSQVAGAVALPVTDLARLECPDCGIKYMDFRKSGRLGCPNDYQVFRDGLLPLLDRVHRATHHTGKRPKSVEGTTASELRRLRRQLRQAISTEAYDEAARLRDRIRAKEREYGS